MTNAVSATCGQVSLALRSELRASGADCAWLDTELSRQAELEATASSSLPTAYAIAGRKFRAVPLELTPSGESALREHGLMQPLWSQRQAARACLLLAHAEITPMGALESQVRDLFYKGDSDERVVVLRCLTLLPTATAHDLLATDAVRSHVQDVFEAIACENPYPQRYFNDLAFNQLVMKAYFTGVAVRRILGLPQRRNLELKRMALDFAAERRAASRTVPADLDEVTQ